MEEKVTQRKAHSSTALSFIESTLVSDSDTFITVHDLLGNFYEWMRENRPSSIFSKSSNDDGREKLMHMIAMTPLATSIVYKDDSPTAKSKYRVVGVNEMTLMDDCKMLLMGYRWRRADEDTM